MRLQTRRGWNAIGSTMKTMKRQGRERSFGCGRGGRTSAEAATKMRVPDQGSRVTADSRWSGFNRGGDGGVGGWRGCLLGSRSVWVGLQTDQRQRARRRLGRTSGRGVLSGWASGEAATTREERGGMALRAWRTGRFFDCREDEGQASSKVTTRWVAVRGSRSDCGRSEFGFNRISDDERGGGPGRSLGS
jgi:hypothetical protein